MTIICQECGQEVEAGEYHDIDDCNTYKKTIIEAHIRAQNMVLFSFSIPKHIPLILSGAKAQTTRIPRKNGEYPYQVGEKVQLYYRSRQGKSCRNCILDCDVRCNNKDAWCREWSNFFGESVITKIIHFSHTILEGMSRTDSENEFEFWLPTIDKLNAGEQESWATLDGFLSFAEADIWFSTTEYIENGEKCTYGKDWIKRDWDCVLWDGQYIARRVA